MPGRMPRAGLDGQPMWASGIATAFLPVLLVGSAALLPTQSLAVVVLEVLVSAVGVALDHRWPCID